MKKLMFIASAMLCGAALAAGDPALMSSSTSLASGVVGYAQSGSIAANTFSLGTSPFVAVGADVVKIQDMVVPTGVTAVPYSQRTTNALQLQVWNGSSYTIYYYLSDAYIESTDEEVTGWANGSGDYTDATIAPGTGYWYKYPTAASSFTLSGQVSEAESVTKNVSDAFNLYGSPYPVSLNLKKVTTTVGAVPYSQRTSKALQLQVWNGSSYTIYYYLSDAYVEATDDEVEGWANGSGDYVEETGAAVNYGFWARSLNGSGTITFEK